MTKLFLSTFLCVLISFCFGQDQPKKIQITYIANEGFLLKTRSHKVIIDGVFRDGYGFFAKPAPEICDQILAGEAPFDSVELCFLTHYHKDHLDAEMMNKYLKKCPNLKLVTNKPALVFIDGNQFGFVKLQRQFCELTPKTNALLSTSISNISIKSLGIKHLTFFQNGIDLEQYMFNAAYYFEMDGINVFHSGDASMETLKDFFLHNKGWKNPVDVVFLYYDILKNGKTDLDYIVKKLKPKQIVIMHLPPTYYIEWKKKLDEWKQSFPNITLFEKSMESTDFEFE